MRPILSVRDFASRIGTPAPRLRQIAANVNAYYKTFPLVDEKNKVRQITAPNEELKRIQRRIKDNVLALFSLGDAAHGGVGGRSPKSNAEKHLGQPCVASVDVKDFYPSIRHTWVYRMFRHEHGFGRDVAHLLTRLTTFSGQLPQGAPTSNDVANLLLASAVDRPLAVEVKRRGINYTRFVDDIVFSGPNPRALINVAGRLLSRRGLAIYRKKAKWQSKAKLKINSSSQPQEVTGLIVNRRSGASVSRKRRDKIRAAILQLRDATDEMALSTAVNSIRGRIAWVRQFNRGAANRLQTYLESTLARRPARRVKAEQPTKKRDYALAVRFLKRRPKKPEVEVPEIAAPVRQPRLDERVAIVVG